MKITSLKLNSFNKKISIFLDGDFAISLNGQVVLAKNLKINQDINQEELKNILLQSLKVELYSLCLEKISIRPRSKKEIELYLIKLIQNKKFNTNNKTVLQIIDKLLKQKNTLINQIINKLIKNQYIDDYKFAKFIVETKTNLKKKGKISIKNTLFKKGVDQKIIDQIISDKSLFPTEKIEENIDFLIAKNYQKVAYKKYIPQKLKQILLKRLISRGYTFDEVISKIDEFVQNK